MENIFQFILLYDKINVDQTNLILSLNILKSYLFNKTIPILNEKNTEEQFIGAFLNISDKFQDSILYTSKTNSFLSGTFLEKFQQFLLGDFSELLDKDLIEKYKGQIQNDLKKGLKPSIFNDYEIVRYMTLKYCISSEIDNKTNDNISNLLKENEIKLFEINFSTQLIIKSWYEGVLKLMFNSFDEYQNNGRMFYIIFFISLIFIEIIVYTIIWRSHEEKLNLLLKGSIELINLIPLEIKNMIIDKLKE